MALIVEDGSAKTDAESYVGVTEAESYLLVREQQAKWLAASEDSKERALRVATQFIDAEFLSRWRGRRASENQALAWPRQNVEDEDHYTLTNSTIPKRLRQAVAEAAVSQLTESGGLWPTTAKDGRSVRRERVRVGQIEREIEYAGSKLERFDNPKIERLLQAYLIPDNAMERA